MRENFRFNKSCCEIFGFNVCNVRFPYERTSVEPCSRYCVTLKPSIIQQLLPKRKCSSKNEIQILFVSKALFVSQPLKQKTTAGLMCTLPE